MRLFILSLLLLFTISFYGQKEYPQDAFRSPVDIPIYLSGTFAELRGNHFHSGIDIKTESVIGKKIYAIGDGYVSRIKISPYGFGKAIYIRHPNGYTSVYAHLHQFEGELASIVKDEQYRRKSFKMDYFPEKDKIKVSKGQVIALGGNSGSSGGPHLHFEIRETRTEHPLNPLFFGFEVKDNIKPTLKRFYIYDYKDGMTGQKTDLTLQNMGAFHRLKFHDTLSVPPQFYFGLNAIDRLNGYPNQNGLYTYEVYSDEKLIFQFSAKEFSFARTRYLNSYIDYTHYKDAGSRIQRSYIEPNNKLRMYDARVENGLISLAEGETRNIKIIARDYAGNKREIKFVVKQDREAKTLPVQKEAKLFKWNEENIYSEEGMTFTIPAGILYKDIYFNAASDEAKSYSFSRLYHIHKENEPLHSYATIRIKPNKDIPSELRSKVCIVSKNSKGSLFYEGGKWDGEHLKVKTRSFGTYYISADTVAPVLKAKNVYNGKKVAGMKSLDFTVSDNLSGVTSYKALLDNKWILLEYDPKNKRLYYLIDEKLSTGEHMLKIYVSDAKGNKSSLSLKIYR